MPAMSPPARAAAHAPARRVLLIEDTLSLQMLYRAVIAATGCEVDVAASAEQGLAIFAATRPPVVLLDLLLPDRDGLALMKDFLDLNPAARVVVITANGSINRAVEAMRAGAQDFLVKPVEEARLVLAVENALKGTAPALPRLASTTPAVVPRPQGTAPAARLPAINGSDFVGSSDAMARVQGKIQSVAQSMATVFITGESGTGKELCALAVHRQSARAGGPFIALNCGAIPQDLLESEVFGHIKGSFTGAISDKPGAAAAADGGTLFLDEVCEMVPALQTKLLRFLQTSTIQPVGSTRPRKVNVRIVCATNRDPLDAVRRGQFREDLYYRLYVVPIHMPPLRDRADDMVEIAEAALARFAAEEGRDFHGLSPAVRDLFRNHPWPGNVRQLLNVIRNVVVLNQGGLVTPDMLPDDLFAERATPPGSVPAPPPQVVPVVADGDPLAGLTLADIERRAVLGALSRHDGSVPRAARELDVAPSTLYRKLAAWGIAPG
ncbi:MAG: sigma-54-dependent transcriptional regulator [Gemmobacter sp.]